MAIEALCRLERQRKRERERQRERGQTFAITVTRTSPVTAETFVTIKGNSTAPDFTICTFKKKSVNPVSVPKILRAGKGTERKKKRN